MTELSNKSSSDLEFTEVTPNEWTSLTKSNLLKLTSNYNLEPYLYTKKNQYPIKSNSSLSSSPNLKYQKRRVPA